MRGYGRRGHGYGTAGGGGWATRALVRLVVWGLAVMAVVCLISAPVQTADTVRTVIAALVHLARTL